MKKAFTLVELLVVIATIGLLASILLVAFSGVNAKSRDSKRDMEVDSISKALEYRYSENGDYPIITDWILIEEDSTFSTEMSEYLTDIPEDPLYGQASGLGEPYSYQYISTDDGQHYAVKVVYETKGIVIVYSSPEGELALGDGGGEMSGSGTPEDPYIITNVIQLQAMKNDLNAYYELGSNINASITSTWNGGDGFEPVGGQAPGTKFAGNLDGKGYKITNLFINRPLEDLVGLFGYVDFGVEIKNVYLENVNITGNSFVGSLAGYIDDGGAVINSYATGTVTGTMDNVGGLVGYNSGDIDDSHSTVNVDGHNHVGGLVGRNLAPITSSYTSGGVVMGNIYVGGLVGRNDGTISNSYTTNNTNGGVFIGGLTGRNDGTIRNSYATGNADGTSGEGYVGGLIGINKGGNVTNSYSVGNASGSEKVGGLIGRNDGGIITNGYWGNSGDASCCGSGSCGDCTKELDVTNFYISSHDVYDTNSPVWDFFTPIWIKAPGNYPVLVP